MNQWTEINFIEGYINKLDLAFAPCWSLLLASSNINGVRHVPAQSFTGQDGDKQQHESYVTLTELCYLRFFLWFILEGILGDALESRIYIESFFGGCLKVRNVSFRCTPCLCFLLRNLTSCSMTLAYNQTLDKEEVNGLTTRLLPPSTSVLFPNTTNGKCSGSDGLA